MASQNTVTPSAASLADRVGAMAGKGPAPVHLWDPPFCGDLDMQIKRDGTWFYQATPIGRPGMVRLFASILKREGDAYFLVTPVEKVGIQVEDAPFVATDFTAAGAGDRQSLTFQTQIGDSVTAGQDHPIRVVRDAKTGEPSPYIDVRAGLEALIDRKTFYRLVELGEVKAQHGADWFGVHSAGNFFPMIPAAELPEA